MTPSISAPLPVVEPATQAELSAVHAEILTPSFPAYELMSLDRLTAEVEHGDTSVRIIRDDEGGLAGCAIGTWYGDARVLLLDYLALRPGARGGGLGGTLLNASVAAWSDQFDPCIVLAEVEHPDHHDAHPQHGDPEARLRFYAREGARLLPLPYFTPGVGEGRPRVGGMMLAVLHAHPDLLGENDETISSEPIARVLHLQAGDEADHDDAQTELIAAAAENPTLPLLRADRVGDVPIGIPDED
jgi:GNAT superfamily N-acetyltransferase